MTGYYDEEVQAALEMIAEAGTECTWKLVGTVLDDDDRPWLGGDDTETDKVTPIAFVPATDGASGFGLTKFRKGDDVQDFSTYGLMGAHEGFEPTLEMELVRGEETLVVVSIDVIKPAEQAVLYILGIE